jgi:hypothetical protein
MDSDLEILNNSAADDEKRLDAIHRLRRATEDWVNPPPWVGDYQALDLLMRIASDEDEGFIRNEAAEALAQIWLSQARLDVQRYWQLSEHAKEIVRSYIEVNNPGLLNQLPD